MRSLPVFAVLFHPFLRLYRPFLPFLCFSLLLIAAPDSMAAPPDSMAAPPDGITAVPDGMAAPPQDVSDNPSGITLKVVTGEFRTVKGDLFIELSDENGEVLSAEIHPVTGKSVTLRFDSLSPGPRAVRLFHDENSNGKLDTNFFGIPTEGYGFSNNPRSRFGEPSLRDRLFEHQADTTIHISLTYW